MTLKTSNKPSNINPLNPNGFSFSFARIPNVNYFVQSINIPDLTLGEVVQATPLSDAYIPGEKLVYGVCNLEFIVDEDMENYLALYRWMVALGKPRNYEQYLNFPTTDTEAYKANLKELAKNYSDGTLLILNNNNGISKIITFKDMFPTGLSSMTFDSKNTDVTYITNSVTLRYSYFTIQSPTSSTAY
jgi:hypothetical protein